ncbi:MAG: hypothetical protein WC824_03565 [Bacteroidota bacterium]|jgi:hypothetical protein
MHTKDPMMEEPAFTNNLARYGKKFVVIMTVIVTSGFTLLALIGVFHPAGHIDIDLGWIIGFQFMMLFLSDFPIPENKLGRIVFGVAIISVVITSFFFGVDLIIYGG